MAWADTESRSDCLSDHRSQSGGYIGCESCSAPESGSLGASDRRKAPQSFPGALWKAAHVMFRVPTPPVLNATLYPRRTCFRLAGHSSPCCVTITCSMTLDEKPKAIRPAVSIDAVAIPPTEATMKLTALVEHILVKQQGHLSEVIAEELNITRVGCIWTW